jgi:hypothetical protein
MAPDDAGCPVCPDSPFKAALEDKHAARESRVRGLPAGSSEGGRDVADKYRIFVRHVPDCGRNACASHGFGRGDNERVPQAVGGDPVAEVGIFTGLGEGVVDQSGGQDPAAGSVEDTGIAAGWSGVVADDYAGTPPIWPNKKYGACSRSTTP